MHEQHISQRLRHLCLIEAQEAVVQPVTSERCPVVRAATLRRLVFVVRKYQVLTASVLARELDSRAAARGLRQAILLQVNLSREATKSGLPRAEAASRVEEIAALAHLELRGLMTIPPPPALPEDNRPFFGDLRRLRDELVAATGLPLPDLSMGMTDDFEVAIEEGATLIRVGTALFGARHLVE